MIDHSAVFSPISFRDVALIDSTFHIEEKEPDEVLTTHLDIDAPDPSFYQDDEAKEIIATLILGVTVKLAVDEDKSPRLIAGARMAGTFALPVGSVPEEDAKDYLRANGVSILYSCIRTHILELARMSAAHNLIIPPIFANELLRQIDENKAIATD